MLLPSFIVIDFEKFDNLPEVKLPEDTYISYKVTTASIPLLDSFFRKLFLSSKKYPFCLLLSGEHEFSNSDFALENTINFLVSFSFHSNYIKTNCDNPIVLFEIDKTDENKYTSLIGEAFKSHGYNGIEAIIIDNSNIFSSKNERKNIRYNLQKDINNLFTEYISSIKKLNSSDSSFFFFLSNPERLPEFLDTIQRAEAVLREDLPQTYYLLLENKSLATKKNELLSKIELLQEQLDSLNNYHLYYNLSDTRYKRQITELMNFYKNEYEILPLWYKRLGHTLKVIMGKRTFRSLFNDNVKKYKD
jgi:hypothetical protein